VAEAEQPLVSGSDCGDGVSAEHIFQRPKGSNQLVSMVSSKCIDNDDIWTMRYTVLVANADLWS
jgi:hypothetical protein